ncbi:unnamed protein product [Owenia fusiformis]|uniref:Uncharacterized protein n=1 Tax=Owenia fusiformis TaxID=6347 RepID=A0A8J1TWQ2_OWEFU|nr:unnamed protein product [Owenia fusiformis]
MAKGWTLLVILAATIAVSYSQQNEINAMGTRFMLVFNRQYRGSPLGSNDVIVTTEEAETTVNLDIPALNISMSRVISPDEPLVYKCPGTIRLENNVKEMKGVRITSDKRVSVFGSNAGLSVDSFLSLPMTDPEVREEYIVASYRALPTTFAQVAVVAFMNNTQVTIVRRNEERNGYDWPNAVNFTLNEFESYMQAVQGGDMTGAMVLSDKPVSVLSGASCAFVPLTSQYCDHLVEQIPPVSTWGGTFMTAPIATRLRGDVFRIICSQDNTTVYNPRFGTRGPTVQKGGYIELNIGSRSTLFFKSTKPCMTVQYNKGITSDNLRSGTDPFMMIVPPLKQYAPRHKFHTIRNRRGQDFSNHVNVIAKTEASTGVSLNGEFLTEWTPIRYTNFSFAQVTNLKYGQYVLQHWSNDVWISASVYGHFGVEGYGNPTGMGLRRGDVEHPPVPISTPAPTRSVASNFTEICKCQIRIEPNITAGETYPGEILEELEPVYYNNSDGECIGCHEVLRTCPQICDQRAREYWGWEGLARLVPVNGTSGSRLRPRGQVLCQIHNGPLNPPGTRVLAYYDPGSCGAPMHTIASSTSLCCAEQDIPEIGYVIVWDRECDSDVEFPLPTDAS